MPPQFTQTSGSARRYAYVTLLMLNDSYLPGALMLAHGLRRQQTRADLVCLVSGEISCGARRMLDRLYDRVIEVDKIFIPHGRTQIRQYTPFVMTRLHALRLGPDGDLNCGYDKITLLDADLLPLKHYDRLFDVAPPAGVLNERKTHLLACDLQGKYVLPPEVSQTGTWDWHRRYDPICPHGCPIPKSLTDRVHSDPTNMGIHGAIFVLHPSMREFHAIRKELSDPQICRHIGTRYLWPDMQYLTARWSGLWTNIDLRFCGFKGYPTLSVLWGTHYAGVKPWQLHKTNAVRRFNRYEDFRYWFRTFARLIACDHPELYGYPPLRKLYTRIVHDAFSRKLKPIDTFHQAGYTPQ